MHDSRVFVRGVGWHPFGRWPDKTLKEMVATAVLAAIDDAAIAARDLGAVFCSNAYAGVLAHSSRCRRCPKRYLPRAFGAR